MVDTNMIYTYKTPEWVGPESLGDDERNRVKELNLAIIDRIEKEAIDRGCLLYRFVYEVTNQGLAIYQIIKVNRVSCLLRYCPLDGINTPTEQWGNEVHVGTEYIMNRVKSWDMAWGYGKIYNELDFMAAEELAYRLGDWYLYIQTCEDGYDYSIYNNSFCLHDGGVYDDDQPAIYEVAQILLEDMRSELTIAEDTMAEPVNPNLLAEAAGTTNAIIRDTLDPVILIRLVMGNAGDEIALKNICEAHMDTMEDLTDEEREYLFATNSFYHNEKEFAYIHSDTGPGDFDGLVEEGIIVQTTDGYVWKDCV